MISIKQALEKMHAGEQFSLKVVQWDKRRKEKRGKLLEVACAELVWGDGGNEKKERMERQPTPLERALMGGNSIDKRDPNHGAHYTRNIRVIIDGHQTEILYKIHPLLIIEFNGQPTTA